MLPSVSRDLAFGSVGWLVWTEPFGIGLVCALHSDSRDSVDQVVPAVGADDGAHLVLPEGEGGVLEGLLHHPAAEKTQIAALAKGAAVASFRCVLRKDLDDSLRPDPGLVSLQLGHGVGGAQQDGFARSPAYRVTAAVARGAVGAIASKNTHVHAQRERERER